MENLRVIRVKVIAPEKPLDVNTFPKNNPDVDFTIYVVSKYLCVDMASCNIQKYFMLIQDYQPTPKITVLDIKPTPYSLASSVLSHSTQSAISHSLSLCVLCLTPHYVSPVLIPHEKRMMFNYYYHCLIDNKRLRMHLLFHLYL